MAEPLHRQTVTELAGRIAVREISPRELLEATIDRIERLNPELNALITLCLDEARREADALTAEAARGRLRGPLHGIPLAVKDLTDTAGLRTTYGSSLYREHVPAADAEPVARLRTAGAIVVGKANTHEFACGTTTTNPHYGATHNPWRRGHVPGGSSGGSGSVVGAHILPLATGSDTGGSIRIPSALCGCVGIKPSYGRVSLRGTFPMAASLDHVGPIARTARDCALALNVMSAYDERDPWSRRFPHEDFTHELDRPLRGMRVAIAPGYRPVPIQAAVQQNFERAAAALRERGAEIVEVALPDAERVMQDGGTVIIGETYAEHAERLAQHADAYGADVRFQLEFAASIPLPALVRAQQARERIAREVESIVSRSADALLMVAVPVEAPPIGDEFVVMEGDVSIPVMSALASYTLLHNLTRLPTVAVPSGRGPLGLPTSVQVTTAFGRDALALAIAHQLEESVWPHHERMPA